MVRIGGGSTKFVLSDKWIVYTKSRKQLLHRKYLLYETGCISILCAWSNCPIELMSGLTDAGPATDKRSLDISNTRTEK